MNTLLKNIDFKSGIIVYDDFDIDLEKPIGEQVYLDEDMLQVKYPQNYILDIGWYGGMNPEGRFVLQIIKNCDWDNPIYKKTTRDLTQLEKYLQECIDVAEKLVISDQIKSKESSFKCQH